MTHSASDDAELNRRPLVVAIDGVAPGIGKSTVASAVVMWLRERGLVVDHFREEDILSRPAFAAVATAFRESGRVEPSLLLAATDALVGDLPPGDVTVLDSLLPFIPSLLAWGHDRATISTFVRDLTHVLRGVRLLTIYLDGSVESALEQAVGREGEAWLPWLIGRYAGTAEPVTDLDSLAAHMEQRRQLTLSVLAEHSWDVVAIRTAQEHQADESLAVVSAALAERGLDH